MHRFANPARFLKFARPLTAWLFWPGLILLLAGAGCGLFVTPADYLQGDTVRILYIHVRSEEHTSELQSLMRISYAVFCLKKKKKTKTVNRAAVYIDNTH